MSRAVYACQQAHDVVTISNGRRSDVKTLHRRQYDISMTSVQRHVPAGLCSVQMGDLDSNEYNITSTKAYLVYVEYFNLFSGSRLMALL